MDWFPSSLFVVLFQLSPFLHGTRTAICIFLLFSLQQPCEEALADRKCLASGHLVLFVTKQGFEANPPSCQYHIWTPYRSG